MAETTNYGLYITEAADNPSFEDWRNALCGSNDSNMQKIDAALANAAPQHFIVTVTINDSGKYEADKTTAEIYSASNSGRLVLAKYDQHIFLPVNIFETACIFQCTLGSSVKRIWLHKNSTGDNQIQITTFKTSASGNPGDFVVIGEDGFMTTITVPLAENEVV